LRQKVDLDSWVRRAHFEFFSTFDEPYYGICVRVDCTKAYAAAKRKGYSFFLYYLYQSIAAAQRVEAFRLRIEDGEVFRYDRIDGGSTVMRPDGTFGFGYYTYDDAIETFMEESGREVERVRGTTGLERRNVPNIIRCSALPWIDFTSLSHARRFAAGDSCPWISFGKMTEENGRRSMPVSIHVHHALVDGVDVGRYVECFQALMNAEPID
jgi:chloramphenicol O-acetyltransferase type A